MSIQSAGRELDAGDVVAGRYRVIEMLGAGGMGTVYRAHHEALSRDVALKVLLPRYALDPDALARFEREAKVAAALSHPGAVRIFDYGRDGDVAFLAMEVLRGRTLRDTLEARGLLPMREVLEVGVGLADVLTAAHEVGLVHRDLKPENVFLEPTPDAERRRVVVVDFGLAFIEEREGQGRMTDAGVVSGTPDYMAPEQASAVRVGPPADIYAAGCLLYELLTGRVPFDGNVMQVLARHLYTAPLPPREVARDRGIDHEVSELVLHMLRKRPEDRPVAEVVHGILSTQLGSPVPERARESIATTGRAARMISAVMRPTQQAVTEPDAAPANVQAEPTQVGVLGALDGDLVLGLATNGLLAYIASGVGDLSDAAAIYAPRASAEQLAELVALGRPVLTDTEAADMERVTRALDLGVEEVLPRPVRSEELARRVWRSIRRARRSSLSRARRSTPDPDDA